MKRCTGLSQTAVCVIPRKAISCLMLSMALLTIFFFIFIEIRRLIWLRSTEKTLFEIDNYQRSSVIYETFNTTRDILKPTIFIEGSNSTSLAEAKPVEDKRSQINDKLLIEDILSDDPLCPSSLFLLVLVVSAPENFEHRDAIRKAWPSTDLDNRLIARSKTKIVFLVGHSSSRFLNVLLKYENEVSEDILLGEFCFELTSH